MTLRTTAFVAVGFAVWAWLLFCTTPALQVMVEGSTALAGGR